MLQGALCYILVIPLILVPFMILEIIDFTSFIVCGVVFFLLGYCFMLGYLKYCMIREEDQYINLKFPKII